MSRLARMMGLTGAVVLGAGVFLAAPAHAATTPTDAELSVLSITCDDQLHSHELILDLDLPTTVNAPVDIVAATLTVNSVALGTPTYAPDPIPANGDHAATTVTITGDQIDSIAASVTIQAAEGGLPVVVNLPAGTTAAACGSGGTTSSTTSTTTGGATTSTTSGATTSTTAGATTSTTAGGSTTTSSTSTTLGPNDTTGTLSVSPSTVAVGGTITVSGTGFAPNVDVTLTVFSDPVSLGTLRSNAAGAISGSVAMPSSVPAGAHKVEAKGANAAGNGINLLKADLTVRAASSTIPRTGGPSDALLPIGLAVVSFGILALAWRERRLTVR